MDKYDFSKIEPQWQTKWEKEKLYQIPNQSPKPKYYDLVMYPYPSGALHMGHMRNYAIGDVLGRYKTMRGFNVLHPIGWDAFGLPAENAAISHGAHPYEWTEKCITRMRQQLKRLGISYDWSRKVTTSHEDYYKWTQWLFLKMHEKGLAYRKNAKINWCPQCKTVLANEQAKDGKCWRCASAVIEKELEQWFLKITAYADRLLDDLKLLQGWPENVRTMQHNWIGKSEGTLISFKIANTQSEPANKLRGSESKEPKRSPVPVQAVSGSVLEVFTTRPDTLFGVTYMVLAPEHPLVEKLTKGTKHEKEVKAYQEKAKHETLSQREETLTAKDGVFTGAYAINPVNNEKVPIWIADYVLMEYGTGAVMAVPAHDQRDFEFAKKYDLPIRVVIEDPKEKMDSSRAKSREKAFVDIGIMVNSTLFNGLKSDQCIPKISAWCEEKGFGKKTINYKLRDWLVSRQRYWGAPIPMIYCKKCGIVPVPEKDLPVKLPRDVKFTGKGKSPLAEVKDFVQTKCPKCHAAARRETDTMDTFICSSWYFLRYTDPQNAKKAFTKEFVDYWMPVDQYIGGIEHAVLHLLYARFFTKVLFDLKYVSCPEPFTNLLTQGMVIKDGAKMSKSKGNVVDPDGIIKKYGADTARLFILFASPPERELEWNDQGVEGSFRFLNRVWRLVSSSKQQSGNDKKLEQKMHQTIKGVTEDIERFSFNTAISKTMELTNTIYEIEGASKEATKTLLLLLSPFAPHICEELWKSLGEKESIHKQSWPKYDPEIAQAKEITLVLQVNGRVRDKLMVSAEISEEEMKKLALENEKVKTHIAGKEVKKVIAVPKKLVNIVVQ